MPAGKMTMIELAAVYNAIIPANPKRVNRHGRVMNRARIAKPAKKVPVTTPREIAVIIPNCGDNNNRIESVMNACVYFSFLNNMKERRTNGKSVKKLIATVSASGYETPHQISGTATKLSSMVL